MAVIWMRKMHLALAFLVRDNQQRLVSGPRSGHVRLPCPVLLGCRSIPFGCLGLITLEQEKLFRHHHILSKKLWDLALFPQQDMLLMKLQGGMMRLDQCLEAIPIEAMLPNPGMPLHRPRLNH